MNCKNEPTEEMIKNSSAINESPSNLHIRKLCISAVHHNCFRKSFALVKNIMKIQSLKTKKIRQKIYRVHLFEFGRISINTM